MAFKMGQRVKDRVTGVTGIIIAMTEYMNSCKRIMIQPAIKESEPDKMPEPIHLDEPDCIFVDDGLMEEVAKERKEREGKSQKPNHGPMRGEDKIRR